jgi:hypothetical protein
MQNLENMSNPLKYIFTIIVYLFALIGLLLVLAYLSVQFGFTKTKGIVDTQHDYFKNASVDLQWTKIPEWETLQVAISKDTTAIQKAAEVTGVPARLMVACLVVEQLRLFTSEREVFKAIFAPLKILGNQSQFSWGVMGIKQDTARAIEAHLTDHTSPWYIGSAYEHTLDYPATSTGDERDALRFTRLTDEHNRYYSYLYAELYIKEIETQWAKAGFAIEDKPEIVATLFNIGFEHSHPNSAPQSGGAEIDINSNTYGFGGLAAEFYYSNQLRDQFPK